MRFFGNSNVRLFQAINLSVYVILTFIFFLTWFNDQNINTLILFGLEATLLGGANYFYLKLNQVYLNGQSVQLRNIFRTIEIDIAQFKSINSTFLSPFFFKIETESQVFYFVPDFEIVLIGFFKRSVVIERLNKEFTEK